MNYPTATLKKLSANLNILVEREAKYAGSAPIDLLNQIADHRTAIELTNQVIAGNLSEAEWREALKPLLLAVNNGQVINLEVHNTGDFVEGDKIQGDKVLGNKVVTNIDVGFEDGIKALGNYFISHIQTFVGIILTPSNTFQQLLYSQKISSDTFVGKVGVSIKPIVFAAINIILGALVASSLSIEGSLSDSGIPLSTTVTSQLFLWMIYSIAIHIVLVKIFRGEGTFGQTMAGVLYVLGTLQPFMLFFIYVVSLLFPGVLSYDLVTRQGKNYTGTFYYNEAVLNFLGVSLIGLYWLISFGLTFSYLYFPLHLAHNLTLKKIIFSYILGILLLIAFFVLSIISILGLLQSIQ